MSAENRNGGRRNEASSNENPSNPAANAANAGRLRWRPQEIAVGAALGAACGVIFWGFDFVYTPLSTVLSALLPGLMSVFHAFWYFSGMLAMLVLRKPGAALYVNLVGCLVESVAGNQFSIASVLIGTLLEGVAAEIPFALRRYRVFDLPMSVCSGALTAVVYGLYLMLFYYQGVAFLSPRGVTHMVSEVVGGMVIGGVMSWYLYLAIGRTGVLDRLPSGRALVASGGRV